MNGANHLTDSLSTYPFAIFGNGWENAMDGKDYLKKEILILVMMFGLATMQPLWQV